jgi:hypothetical protein
LTWLVELISIEFNLFKLLNMSQSCLYAIIFGLSGYYLLKIFLNPQKTYKENPFFWISLGFLIYPFCTATSLLPLSQNADDKLKDLFKILLGVIGFVFYVLMAIGAWKTKDWVLQKNNTTTSIL